jgi:hypothetical protein
MQGSPYLAQALQQMQAQPEVAAPQVDLQALAQAAKARKTFEADNPGKSYMKHQAQTALNSFKAMPGNVAGAVQGIPGQLAGLFSLGGR